MRLSPFKASPATKVGDASTSNADFFRLVAERSGAENLPGAILLIGGSDFSARAIRRAQGALRMDRRTSQWSHAAIITDWASDPANARGVEVTLQPSEDAAQVPERNGVTLFRLRRYLDAKRYPNIGLCVPTFRKRKKGEEESPLAKDPDERRALLVAAALSPNRDRERYPLWDLLAPWAHYAYAPDTSPNPLIEGRPLPSAALCEYAYEAIGADLTPGATGNHSSPEVLYATMKHWESGLDQMAFVSLALFTRVLDEHGTPPEALSLDVTGAGAKAAKKAPAKKKSPRTAAKKARTKTKAKRKARR